MPQLAEEKRTEKVPVQEGAEQNCSGMQTPDNVVAEPSGETAALQ